MMSQNSEQLLNEKTENPLHERQKYDPLSNCRADNGSPGWPLTTEGVPILAAYGKDWETRREGDLGIENDVGSSQCDNPHFLCT